MKKSSPVSTSSSSLTATTTTTTSSSSSTWYATILLLVLLIVQWIYFTILIHNQYYYYYYYYSTSSTASSSFNEYLPIEITQQESQLQLQQLQKKFHQIQYNYTKLLQQQQSYDGVFVTVLLSSSISSNQKSNKIPILYILQNAISNLPKNSKWIVQIFIDEILLNESKDSSSLYNTIQEYSMNNKVILTVIPSSILSQTTTKPNSFSIYDKLYQSLWFWESIIADAVLLFTTIESNTNDGTINAGSAFCGNTIQDPILYWAQMALNVDYCGIPILTTTTTTTTMTSTSNASYKYGGDGSTHSFRNRKAMIRVLHYQQQQQQKRQLSTGTKVTSDFIGDSRMNGEWYQTLETMKEMNLAISQQQQQQKLSTESEQQNSLFRIATYNDTIQFGGVYNLSNDVSLIHLPFLVSYNTLVQALTYSERDSVLKHCPESKIIFYPSLHEPHCFGAHPKPNECKASICALQESIPIDGC